MILLILLILLIVLWILLAVGAGMHFEELERKDPRKKKSKER